MLLDGLTDQRLAWVRAHVLVVGGVDDAGKAARRLGRMRHVDGAGDVDAAVTDKDADS